jgi:aspartyl/asparaginyl-tRNA synthetase
MYSRLMQLFRESLLNQGFIEIHTPKLLSGASEGGAAVFHFDYMGRPGCLAQSPQFYKQMAICSDLGRVFEIGPVFRAENSYTHRHLCEFTGLDMEMAICESYHEVLDVLDALFVHMFQVRSREGSDVHVAWRVAVLGADCPPAIMLCSRASRSSPRHTTSLLPDSFAGPEREMCTGAGRDWRAVPL